MIKALLILHVKQSLREGASLGLFRSLFLLVIVSLASLLLFKLSAEPKYALIAVALYGAIITLIDYRREDRLFLKTHFINCWKVYAIEYALLAIPWVVTLSYHAQWLPLALLLLLLILQATIHLSFQKKGRNSLLQKWILPENYEWKAGARKHLILLLTVWTISLVCSPITGIIPVALLIIGVIPLSFYEIGEPYQFIVAQERSACAFLSKKIGDNLKIFILITAPLLISFTLFHPELWYIPTVEILILSTLHIFYMLTKYAFYQPNQKSSTTSLLNSLATIALFVPFLLPVVWIASIRFYRKSISNLNPYLHDFS